MRDSPRPPLRRLLLVGGMLFGLAGPARAAECDLYVRASAAGGETGDGTAPDRAFASITEAAAAIDNPGVVVCVGPGTYGEGAIAPRLSGSQVSPITFRADATGAATGDPPGPVVISAEGLPAGVGAAFLLMGKRHIAIEGFTIVGFADAGIQVRSGASEADGNSGNIVVRGNSIHDCGAGIDVSAEDEIVIEDNDVIDGTSTGIAVSACRGPALTNARCRAGESARVVPRLSNNRVIYNFSHGVFIQEAAGGYVQNSIAFGNFSGITLRTTTDTRIVNNLLYGNASDGATVGAAGQRSTGTILLNNTLYNNGAWGIRVGDESSNSDDTRVLNNILARNGNGSITASRPSTCGYVAGFNLVDVKASYGPDTPANAAYDLRADPGFVDPSGPDGILGWQVRNGSLVDYSADDDFRLRGGSAAIDAGYSTASALGLQGSALPQAASDSGATDLGYHYGAPSTQRLQNLPTDPFMPVFVREGGDDAQSGRTTATAVASLARAASLAKAGVTVLVGPGVYPAANVGPTAYSGKVAFRGDATGGLTGDLPGPVVVDPSLLGSGQNKDTGFLLLRTCAVTIAGFHVRFAADSGIQVREGADGSVVRDNVVFTNKRGISVVDANDVMVVNNLVYDNDTGGIDVGGKTIAARARLQNNTVHANVNGNGVTVGIGTATTPGARVEFNMISGNGANGIYARESYAGRYNLFADNREGHFGGIAGRQDGDLVNMDPRFVEPAGQDGRLGGKRFADDRFELRQAAVGDAETSPAVNAGPITAEKAGMSTGTTRIDGDADAGLVDLGFHYAARPADALFVDPNGSDTNSGRLADLPLQTIAEALRRATGGTMVHVRAGVYAEANLHPGSGVAVIGAGTGASMLDASSGTVGFDVRQPGVRLQGLAISGASDAGIRIRADEVHVVDSWVHGNAGRGIVVGEGADAVLFNNLVYGNGSTGIVVGSAKVGSERATVAHNTLYGNGGFGASIGLDASVPSPGTVVAANVIEGNTLKGIAAGAESAASMHVGHNCNRDGYRGVSQPATDLVTADPLLLAPTAEPVPDFRLAQIAAGDAYASPCVDAGFRTAAQLGLSDATTRRDERGDGGLADIGYHYGLGAFDAAIVPLLRFGAPSGDCDDDGATRVNDLVLGVNIALGAQPLGTCPTLDVNGDSRVAINELLGAVNELLGD